TGQLCGKPATETPSVHDEMLFPKLCCQCSIHKLHIVQHVFFRALTGAFAKASVIYQHHIIVVAGKIHGIFGPAFYTATIAMKIENPPVWLEYCKTPAIDAHVGFHIKK